MGRLSGWAYLGGVRVISDRSKKNATTESEQFNSLLEQRLAKVKAATVDISKQLDDIEPHFTQTLWMTNEHGRRRREHNRH